MGEVERPRQYRTLRSFLVPQMRIPIVSLWLRLAPVAPEPNCPKFSGQFGAPGSPAVCL
jgi:hypothetical protein